MLFVRLDLILILCFWIMCHRVTWTGESKLIASLNCYLLSAWKQASDKLRFTNSSHAMAQNSETENTTPQNQGRVGKIVD